MTKELEALEKIKKLMHDFTNKYEVEPNLLVISSKDLARLSAQNPGYLRYDEKDKNNLKIFGLSIQIVRFGEMEVYYDNTR